MSTLYASMSMHRYDAVACSEGCMTPHMNVFRYA